MSLYQENLELMARYPPQYGISANRDIEKVKNPIAGSLIN